MSDLNRRQFNQLATAAFGGIVAGSIAGCGDKKKDGDKKGDDKKGGDKKGGDGSGTKGNGETDTHNAALLLEEPHVCRGLNTCKGKGKCMGEKNACAGQGNCATAKAHSCHKENDCKGQGGCGDYPGQNTCKGKGECGVPLSDKAWTTARKAFEEQMKKAGKMFGDAPAKKKS